VAITPKTKEQTLAWLRTISGELSTATLKRLDDTLPWYGDMPPGRRRRRPPRSTASTSGLRTS
jgi:hypothetical protein